MAKKLKKPSSVKPSLDLQNFGRQFKGLDSRNPAAWPIAPRILLLLGIAVIVVVALWFAWLKGVKEQLDAARAEEVRLRGDYSTKVARAVNLEALKQQRQQVEQYVNLLEKQLPSKAEMDALLSDINQAGVGRNLQFELFKPGQINVKDYYAELPIEVKVQGGFHDIGAFTADIANLSRIVTLNNIQIEPFKEKDGKTRAGNDLIFSAVAKTFRYLDQEEIAAQRKAQQDAKNKGAKK